jgi:hypothetical protein
VLRKKVSLTGFGGEAECLEFGEQRGVQITIQRNQLYLVL